MESLRPAKPGGGRLMPSSAIGKAVAAAVVLGGAGGLISAYNAHKKQAADARRRRNADRENSEVQSGAAPAEPKKSRRSPGKSLKAILSSLLQLGGKRILMLIGLAIARTALSNRLARIQGHLFRAAFLRRVPLFFRNLAENVALCAATSAIESTLGSITRGLEVLWRDKLTSRLHKGYFDQMAYYKMSYVDKRIDAPEQRICEDVPKLCGGLADLTGEWINAFIEGAFYAWKLRSYSRTNKYTLAIVAYIFSAGTLTAILSPPFGSLYKKQQTLEGTYRHLHARLRTHSEAVALYGGVPKEGATIMGRFRELVRHTSKVLQLQWKFGMVQDFFLKYLGATVAVGLIIGPFFGGHLRPDDSVAGRAQMLSNMRYHTAVVISLFGALGTLAASSRKFMKLGAYADRVAEMEDVVRDLNRQQAASMDAHPPPAHGAANGATPEGASTAVGNYKSVEGTVADATDEIRFEEATVVTPGNATLVRDLNLRVPLGTNLLVTGPNGAGKSSLFRVLGGLWPLTKGKIAKPGGNSGAGLASEIFYVPQRPYVTIGTLEEQILYPVTKKGHERHVPLIQEGEMRELLRAVELEYLLEREGGARAVVPWGDVLSLGEQQRLGMARLFYHKPKFAILDECTSGVTNDMEQRFCQRVQEMGCTCITISHRPALMAFHDTVLHLDGEGGWSIHEGGHHAGHPAAPSASPAADASSAGGAGPGKKKKKGGAAAAAAAPDDKVRALESIKVLEGMTAQAADIRNSCQSGLDLTEKVLDRAPPPDAEREAALTATAVRSALRPNFSRGVGQRFRDLMRILLTGPQGLEVSRLLMIGGVVIARTALSDRIASLNGQTVKFVLRQDRAGFIRLIGVSVLQSALSAVTAPSLRYLTDALALLWRRRLTQVLSQSYLKGAAYYSAVNLAGMSDADQRVTRDIERLCEDLAALIPTMVKPVVDITWFSWRMWMLTGRRGIGLLYLYIVLGFGALRAVTPNFGALAAEEHHKEGAFRHVHNRLRSHAESVAFYGGGKTEGETVTRHFRDLLGHMNKVIHLKFFYNAADDFFTKQLPHNVTWGLTLLYAMENLVDGTDTDGQGSVVHNMRYLASVVSQCFTAFGEILGLNKRITELAGGVTRVQELLEVVQEANRREANLGADGVLPLAGGAAEGTGAGRGARGVGALGRIQEEHEGDEGVAMRGVDIVTPQGKMLARQLNLDLRPGANLLVTGPNGAGKSSVFRVLRGLWPAISGSLARKGTVFYVSQRPYTTVGSFREQLIFPLTVDEAVAQQEGAIEADRRAALDRKLAHILEQVRLSYLLERYRWDSTETEWGDVLSLGEQQRLGMARLFYHKPKFAILDECTNATSVDVEERLYETAEELGITLVTVTQRTALVRFHGRELRLLDGQGCWEMLAIAEDKHPAAQVTAA